MSKGPDAHGESQEDKYHNISKIDFISQLEKSTVDLAKTIAKKHNLPEDSVLECIPKEIQLKIINLKSNKKSKEAKGKVEKIADYREAEKLDDLKLFKIEELKNICIENNLAISGSKVNLMNRVWCINHPEDCKEEIPKKKGRKLKDNLVEKKERKSKKKIEEAINIEEENSSNIELDPEKMEDICIDDNGNKIDSGGRALKVLQNKWVFQDDKESMEFVGVLESENKVLFIDEPPEEFYNNNIK